MADRMPAEHRQQQKEARDRHVGRTQRRFGDDAPGRLDRGNDERGGAVPVQLTRLHVRYAAESGSKFRAFDDTSTGYCGLMALPET